MWRFYPLIGECVLYASLDNKDSSIAFVVYAQKVDTIDNLLGKELPQRNLFLKDYHSRPLLG